MCHKKLSFLFLNLFSLPTLCPLSGQECIRNCHLSLGDQFVLAAQDFPSFSTQSPGYWETPQSHAPWDSWSPYVLIKPKPHSTSSLISHNDQPHLDVPQSQGLPHTRCCPQWFLLIPEASTLVSPPPESSQGGSHRTLGLR